jgi:hypothetical protein
MQVLLEWAIRSRQICSRDACRSDLFFCSAEIFLQEKIYRVAALFFSISLSFPLSALALQRDNGNFIDENLSMYA